MSDKPILKGVVKSGFSGSQVIGNLLGLASFSKMLSECFWKPSISQTMLAHRINSAIDSEKEYGIAKSSIVGLLCRGFPSYVSRCIMAVIVVSSKAVARAWASTNSGQKVQIAIPSQPFITYCDSTTAPFWITFILLVITTVFHMGPGTIFWSSYVVAAFAVYAVAKVWHGDSFFVQTSARLALAFSEHPSAYRFFIAALTVAFPKSSSYRSTGEVLFDNGPSSESASCEFLKRSHGVNIGIDANKINTILTCVSH